MEHTGSHDHTTEMFEPDAWEARYSGHGQVWSGQPNPQLVAEVSGLTPGTALDVGCGEGGDVIWLAQHGWQVTGADFSAQGLARAAAHAEQAGVADRTDWWQVDARSFEAEGRSYDLVTTHFLHPPDGGMVEVTRRLCEAVAPGGHLLVVGHAPSDTHTQLTDSHRRAMFVAADLVPGLAADFEVLVVEQRPRTVTPRRPHPRHPRLHAARPARVGASGSQGGEHASHGGGIGLGVVAEVQRGRPAVELVEREPAPECGQEEGRARAQLDDVCVLAQLGDRVGGAGEIEPGAQLAPDLPSFAPERLEGPPLDPGVEVAADQPVQGWQKTRPGRYDVVVVAGQQEQRVGVLRQEAQLVAVEGVGHDHAHGLGRTRGSTPAAVVSQNQYSWTRARHSLVRVPRVVGG